MEMFEDDSADMCTMHNVGPGEVGVGGIFAFFLYFKCIVALLCVFRFAVFFLSGFILASCQPFKYARTKVYLLFVIFFKRKTSVLP